MRLLVLLLITVLSVIWARTVKLPAPYSDFCILENNTNLYDPKKHLEVPWYNVSLDVPPDQRWREISIAYAQEIKDLIGVLIDLITPIFPNAMGWVDIMFGELEKGLPQPYRDEILSISNDTGIPVGQIVVYNIFYEIFTVCTSIVAQDSDGHIVHARNLDFGLFLGWKPETHEWAMSSALRKMTINVNWIKDAYADAKAHLMTTPILSPVYYILGGKNPGEGSVITRSLTKLICLMSSIPAEKMGGIYWRQTMIWTNRYSTWMIGVRLVTTVCKLLGQNNVSFQGLFNVLSSRTTLNKLTVYTVLMEVESGEFETIMQSCPGDCWAF